MKRQLKPILFTPYVILLGIFFTLVVYIISTALDLSFNIN